MLWSTVHDYFSKVDYTDPSQYYVWRRPEDPNLWEQVRLAQLQYIFWINSPVSPLQPSYWARQLNFQYNVSYWNNYRDRLSQYTYWSQAVDHAIRERKILNAWYFGWNVDKVQDLEIYFKACDKTANLEYNDRFQSRSMVLYYCHS